MTILVTGCAGFLGRAFMRTALSERVVGIDAVPYPDPLGRNQETHVVDMLDADRVSMIVAGAEPTRIVHLAAHSSTGYGAEKIADNVGMTWNLLRAARRHGRPRVVVAGSAAEYGDVSVPMQETRLPDPIDDYGLSKLATTMMSCAMALDHDLPVCVLRFGNLYGPGQTKGFVPSVIRSIVEGRPVRLNGRGQAVRPWLYVSDAVAAIHAGFAADGVYNVAEADHTLWSVAVVIAEEITCLCLKNGEIVTPRLDPVDDPCGAAVVSMDTNLFRQRHNFRPVVSLTRGIAHTVAPFFEVKS